MAKVCRSRLSGDDRAGNMSGIYEGVTVKMKENNPHVMYEQTTRTNLALVDASKSIISLRSTLRTLQQIYCFIGAAPKRHAVFVTI